MKDVILLAEPKTPAWDFAEKIHNYIKDTKEKAIDIFELEKINFNDGEFKPHVKQNIRQKDTFFIQSTSNKSPSDWWVELLLVKNACRKADVNTLSFVLPYIRYMRQDRKDKSRVSISTRAVADSISGGIERIITMDLHSPQIESAYPEDVPVDNLQSSTQVVRYLRENYPSYLENLAIVSPDVGGGGRARSIKRSFTKSETSYNNMKREYSLAIMDKVRNDEGEIIDMTLIGDVNKKNILVVDDILDSGGSAIKASEILKKNGALSMAYYATHGLFTKGTKGILNAYDVVMISNTHYTPKEEDGDIKIIDMAPTFAEAIYRAHEGMSVSKLFD